MRQLIFLFIFLFSSSCFAQNSGFIIGKVIDKELNNDPLCFANVSLKGTNIVSTSDLNGSFFIEHLDVGNYTLICQFPGYKTKEIEVKVTPGNYTEVKLGLDAKSIPMLEARSISTVSKNEYKKTTALN